MRAIIEAYYKNDDFMVVNEKPGGFKILGLFVPHGAICGKDKRGIYVVRNCAVKNWRNGDLGVYVLRYNDVTHRWEENPERGKTTEIILDKFLFEFTYLNQTLYSLSLDINGRYAPYEDRKKVSYHEMNYNRKVPRKARCKPRTRIG